MSRRSPWGEDTVAMRGDAAEESQPQQAGTAVRAATRTTKKPENFNPQRRRAASGRQPLVKLGMTLAITVAAAWVIASNNEDAAESRSRATITEPPRRQAAMPTHRQRPREALRSANPPSSSKPRIHRRLSQRPTTRVVGEASLPAEPEIDATPVPSPPVSGSDSSATPTSPAVEFGM